MTFESVAIIGAISTLITAIMMWENKRNNALMKFVTDTMKRGEEYHTLKNGHMERMAKDFTLTISKLDEKIDKANENQLNITGVLDSCARALKDYNSKK